MADQTFQIGTGETYTTIAGWEAASDVSTGFWKGELKDTTAYGGVTIAGVTGTPSISNYVWLSATSGNKHSGKSGTTHARIEAKGAGAVTISDDFTRIDDIEIRLAGSNNSDEAIRITANTNDVLISRCILWTNTTQVDKDGVYTGNWAASYSIDNCIIYGFYRAGLNIQNYSTTSTTQDVNIDYCTIVKCGSSGETESSGINSRTGTGGINNIAVYNTGCFDTASTYDDFGNATESGTTNWSGTNNASSDASLTSRGIATNAQESLTTSDTTQSSGSYAVFQSKTVSSEDYQLLDEAAGNLLIGNAVNRVGSEPDARQDFSLDIVGNTRNTTGPSPDIGASDIFTSGADININATSATHTQTTYNPVISYDVTITPTSAAHTLATFNPSVSYDVGIDATSKALTHTTFNPAVSFDVGITATTVVFTQTTYNPVIDFGADTEIVATSASHTLTTYNPAVSYDLDFTPNSQAQTLTTFNPVVDYTYTFEPNSKTLTQTTYNVIIDYDTEIEATSQALTQTVYNPVVSYDTGIAPDAEGLEYTLVGNRLGYEFNENLTHYGFENNKVHYEFNDEDL